MSLNKQSVDAWARQEGYTDFDTYIRCGGSLGDAMARVHQQIARLRAVQQVMATWRAGALCVSSGEHVYPPDAPIGVADTAPRAHVASAACWCGPIPDPEEPSVLVHRDGELEQRIVTAQAAVEGADDH